MILEDLKKKVREENLNELRKEIDSNWLSKKIENHLERNPFIQETKEQIKERLTEDNLLASFFIKDPNKQNINEKYIAEIIQKMSLVENFQNLSSTIPLFVINGKVVSERYDDVKSIDFTWETKGKKVYTSQKYTNYDRGGAQDNQKNDIILFLKHSLESKDSDIFFFAIVDGGYYNEKTVSNLRETYESSNVKICRTEELEEYLEKI